MENLSSKMKKKSAKMSIALRAVALVLLLGVGFGQLAAQPLPVRKIEKGSKTKMKTRDEDPGYYLDKYVNADGDMLTLESYVTGRTIVVEKALPADICLVLDVSGSMRDYMTDEYKFVVNDDFTRYEIEDFGYYSGGVFQLDYNTQYYYKLTDADGEHYIQVHPICNWGSRYDCTWLYFEYPKGVTRYYLHGTEVIQAMNCEDPTYSQGNTSGTQPMSVSGSVIQFTYDDEIIWTGTLYEKEELTEIRKYLALERAACQFVDVVRQSAIDNPIDDAPANHRISVVKFCDDDYPGPDADYFLAEGNTDNEVTEVRVNFRNVVDKADSLKYYISSMFIGGATAADYGMTLATRLFSEQNYRNRQPFYDPTAERSRVAVLFTDGEPNHGNGFSTTVANNTIDLAKQLKAAGYKVYTVGVFDRLTENILTYMNAVSSNYPDATSMSNLGTQEFDSYFFTADEAGSLEDIFETIAKESSQVKYNLNESTVILDLISEYFELPDGTTAENIGVYTAKCNGISDGVLQFDEPLPMTDPIPNVVIDGKTVSVSNFHFGDNWCGPHSGGVYDGHKLVIRIPIEPAPDAPIGTHPTNGSGSGFYPNGEEQPIDSFPFPKYYVYGKTWVEHVTAAPGVEHIKLVGDEYEIYSEEGLAWFISIVSGYNGMPGNSAAKAKLMADVNMSDYLWVPIGGWGYCKNVQTLGGSNFIYSYPKAHGFSGTFNGQGHVIRGLNNIDPITMPQGGMFGKVNGGTVKNTFVIGCQVVGAVGTEANSAAQLCTGTEGHFGIIADTLCGGGTIFNCEAEGTIMTYDTISNMFKDTPIDPLYENPEKAYIGGLVGVVTGNSKVHSCISVASLLGYNMGGIAYQVEAGSKVQNCYSYALFNSWFPTIGSNLGGLVAVNNGDVQNCYLRNRANETKTVHVNLPEITFTGIHGAVDAAGKNNVRGTWHKGLLIGQNTGSATGIYVPKEWKDCPAKDTENNSVCFVGFESSNAAQNVGWFTDAVTPYLYQHNDTQVTMIGERETSARLLQTLNNWANANDCTPWMRTTADGINNDYPVLKIDEFQYVAADNVAVIYGDDVNDVLDSRKLMTTGKGDDVIYLYKNAELTKANTGDDAATLYIDENVAVTQKSDGLVNTAYVGITLDNSAGEYGVNSDHGFAADAIDWHMFATSLSRAPLGINYNGDIQNWPFEYGHPTDMPYYSFYDESEQDGYFPSKTFGTDGTDGIDYYSDWDFYCWDEKYQHYINFKRNSNSHWYEGAPQQIAYTNESELVPGKGYMLAIANETFLQSHGTLNNGTVTRNVTYHENPFCPGYNLIGNPYQSYLDFDEFARKNSGINTYAIIDEDSTSYIYYTATSVADSCKRFLNMHQGFFIKVNGNNPVTFDNDMRSLKPVEGTHFRGEGRTSYPFLKLTVTEANGIRDHATVEFNRPELGGGEKFMDLRAGNAQIYVHNGETNYSTLFATSDIDEVSVRFNTLEDGTFTLSWQLSEGDFNEMYLIDNINGQKTDMLTHNNYKFEGHAADYASRFNVVFHLDGDNNSESDVEPVESFAFQMGGNLIVNGMGTCQVFDLTGRLVSTNQLTDTQNTMALPQTAGLYLVRLVNGSSVKVQKIVVE